ncbi:hypothetical protein RB195_020930 [Necator americanus]|uniref:Uncharacterized protein n=1 Tax=Necator americanus TaxID=51031 RepID=A0ABR1CMC1_NECAM
MWLHCTERLLLLNAIHLSKRSNLKEEVSTLIEQRKRTSQLNKMTDESENFTVPEPSRHEEKIPVLKGIILLLLIGAGLISGGFLCAVFLWVASKKMPSTKSCGEDVGTSVRDTGPTAVQQEVLDKDKNVLIESQANQQSFLNRIESTRLKHALDNEQSHSIREITFDLDPTHVEEGGLSADYLQINAVYNPPSSGQGKSNANNNMNEETEKKSDTKAADIQAETINPQEKSSKEPTIGSGEKNTDYNGEKERTITSDEKIIHGLDVSEIFHSSPQAKTNHNKESLKVPGSSIQQRKDEEFNRFFDVE